MRSAVEVLLQNARVQRFDFHGLGEHGLGGLFLERLIVDQEAKSPAVVGADSMTFADFALTSRFENSHHGPPIYYEPLQK